METFSISFLQFFEAITEVLIAFMGYLPGIFLSASAEAYTYWLGISPGDEAIALSTLQTVSDILDRMIY